MTETPPARPDTPPARSIVLIGMMGVGKTTIGRRLAKRLALPFVDADTELEKAAGCSIPDIFALHGEAAFRAGEQRVLARLLTQPPQVIATGGGAFMNAETRRLIQARGTAVWLRADLDVLVRRVKRNHNRPLLRKGDPQEILARLMRERDPIYGEADFAVESNEGEPEQVVDAIIGQLRQRQPLPPSSEPMTALPITVPVALGERSYDIVVGPGLIERVGEFLRPVLPRPVTAIVTDEQVARLHLPALQAALDAASIRYSAIVVPAGEQSKDFRHLEQVTNGLLDARIERSDPIIALGGGVIGDLTGFAASILRRGAPVVQIPTTLLAQVDSSVGGKTGINTRQGKNLVGTFHQPSLVLADVGALATLPPREFRAGYAEVVKYGLLGDAPFFAWLEENGHKVMAQDPAALTHAVVTSCRAKAAIVARDEHEHGDRALLNLGHTFAHAIETAAGYGTVLHGEAVSVGMVCAFDLSARLGLCPAEDVARVIRHLRATGMPVGWRDLGNRWDPAELVRHMAQDKKARGGTITFVLTRGIGKAFLSRDVTAADVEAVLAQDLAA